MTTATPDTSASSPAVAGRSLLEMLESRASAKDIERHLDALSPSKRLAEVLAVTGKGVKAFYDALADAPSLSLDELVPPEMGSGTVILEGRNSLPLFSRFQKRFARVADGSIVGYNHQSMAFVTGPGYFVVRAPDGKGPLGREVLIDYTAAPSAEPAGWPAYKPNDRGLSRPVYMHMKDYLRRAARGVYVGKAYKLGVDQKAYFSLTRAD